MTETERAYVAGLIDGEGCISLFFNHWNGAKNGSTLCRIIIGMCDDAVIRWLQKTVGSGSVYRRQRASGNWKDITTITWNGGAGSELLKLLMPYLRVKRRQAEIFIDWVELSRTKYKPVGRRGGATYPDWVVKRRDQYLAEMRVLNQKGILRKSKAVNA